MILAIIWLVAGTGPMERSNAGEPRFARAILLGLPAEDSESVLYEEVRARIRNYATRYSQIAAPGIFWSH